MSDVEISLHPELIRHQEFYTGVADFADGSKARIASYLDRYDAENDKSDKGKKAFASRLRRAYNKNWVKPFLILHVGHLSQATTFNLGKNEAPVWTQIKEDVTRYGESANQMIRELLRLYCRDGMCGVLVDGPKATEKGDSKADAQANKERSWQVRYEAREILYWSHFAEGELMGELKELVLRAGVHVEGDKEFVKLRRFTREGDTVTCQVLGSLEECKTLNVLWKQKSKFKVLDTSQLQLGYIPFVFFGTGPEIHSVIGLLWELNRAILNCGSVESNTNYMQGFQRVCYFGVNQAEVQETGEWLGTLINNEKARVEAIPPGNPESVRMERKDLEWFATRCGKLEFNQLSDDTKQVQSADSKRLDTQGRKALYDFVLDLFEEGLMRIFQCHADFEGLSDTDINAITVRIERDYGLEDEEKAAVDREQAFSMAQRLGVLELQKEILKVTISKMVFVARDNMSPEEVKAEMMKAVDSAKGPQAQGSGLANVFDRIRQNTAPPANGAPAQ